MDDLIYRQAAIDAILAVTGNSSVRELYEHVQEHGLSDMWSGGVNAAIDIIIAVPSAQPKILACGEGELNVPDTNVGDIISRKAAIDAVMELFRRVPTNAIRAKKVIEKLPSAQPEPLTDKEQRIFLAAMSREEKVCKQVDEECRDCREPYEDSLVWTCHEITRKVKGALWDGK